MHNNTQTLNDIKTLGAEPVELLNSKLVMLFGIWRRQFLGWACEAEQYQCSQSGGIKQSHPSQRGTIVKNLIIQMRQ